MEKKVFSIRDLSVDDLLKSDIETVFFVENFGKYQDRFIPNLISREDYILCYNKCKEIVDEIKQDHEFENEKDLFAYLYILIANINDSALDSEIVFNNLQEKIKQNDYNEISRIQGLYNVLFNKPCACHGRAFTLNNLCSLLGIESVVVNGCAKNGKMHHSWNVVRLDGKWYETDLQWDLKRIWKKELPLKEFLKSHKDFKHDMFDTSIENKLEQFCRQSISDEEQEEIINKYLDKETIARKL